MIKNFRKKCIYICVLLMCVSIVPSALFGCAGHTKRLFTEEIIALDAQKSQNMSFVIYAEQHNKKKSELFVVDGGWEQDAKYLVSTLTDYGGHVNAWFLSHFHIDHIGALYEILTNDELKSKIQIDEIFYLFPPEEDIIAVDEAEEDIEIFRKIGCVLAETSIKQTIYKKGDIYRYKSTDVEVLRTYNPQIKANAGNNSSTVLSFSFEKKKMLFLGDLGVEGGRELLATCDANKLKSDIVQMAHHGQNGVGREVYEAINPSVCFWNTPLWLWNNDNGGGINSGPWKTYEVRGWIDEMGAISLVAAKKPVGIKTDGEKIEILPLSEGI